MQLQFNLVGFNHYGFTNDSGQYVEGYKFSINRPCSSRGFKGLEACSVSVSEQTVQKCGEPQLNTVYDVVYDQKGRIAHYSPATRK